jgi:hypothetical protein
VHTAAGASWSRSGGLKLFCLFQDDFFHDLAQPDAIHSTYQKGGEVMKELDEKTMAIRAGYRKSTWQFFVGVLALMALAALAPLATLTIDWVPLGESRSSWFQRSGAVTTLFSFLAAALAVVTSGRLHTPGTFGSQNKIEVLIEFKKRFGFAEIGLLILTLLGTVIWGYGDILLRWIDLSN